MIIHPKKNYRKKLVNRPTRAENRLMHLMAVDPDFDGEYKFQYRIRGFFVDFYFHRRNVVVEVDGGYHRDREMYDIERSLIIERSKGSKILRFSNRQVFENPQYVIKKIKQYALYTQKHTLHA